MPSIPRCVGSRLGRIAIDSHRITNADSQFALAFAVLPLCKRVYPSVRAENPDFEKALKPSSAIAVFPGLDTINGVFTATRSLRNPLSF